ncbi:MAG: hypothetical protein LDL27_03225 [Desulfovibrio sp.]|nr:hypothetical protein [Desulfovibrio sp.]
MRNFMWWLGFIICCLWAQRLVQGVDFLVVGLVISAREGRPLQTAWLFVTFLLLQEGAGTLAFGAGLLWQGGVMLLYVLGRWLFETRNVLFIFLMGCCLGVWRYALIHGMAALQEYTLSPRSMFLWECLLQALLFPLAWSIAHALRGRPEVDAATV